jgi:hypothetical protein
MSQDLRSTKSVLETLKCGRSTFYEHLKKSGIKPKKHGNKSFFTHEQIEALKKSLYCPDFETYTEDSDTDSRQTQERQKEKNEKLSDYLIT